MSVEKFKAKKNLLNYSYHCRVEIVYTKITLLTCSFIFFTNWCSKSLSEKKKLNIQIEINLTKFELLNSAHKATKKMSKWREKEKWKQKNSHTQKKRKRTKLSNRNFQHNEMNEGKKSDEKKHGNF